MSAIKLKITTPSKVVKEINAEWVIIPAKEGDMAVLPDKAPQIVQLRAGCVKISGVDENILIKGGVADISLNTCTISTEAVEE